MIIQNRTQNNGIQRVKQYFAAHRPKFTRQVCVLFSLYLEFLAVMTVGNIFGEPLTAAVHTERQWFAFLIAQVIPRLKVRRRRRFEALARSG